MIPIDLNECLEEKWGQGQFTEQLMDFILFQLLLSHHSCILQDVQSNSPVKIKEVEDIYRKKIMKTMPGVEHLKWELDKHLVSPVMHQGDIKNGLSYILNIGMCGYK